MLKVLKVERMNEEQLRAKFALFDEDNSGFLSSKELANLCYSFGTSIFVYIIINMSMVLGLLPIVGSPLPIMSYGGSSMLATMIGFGIVMSARVHNQQLIA